MKEARPITEDAPVAAEQPDRTADGVSLVDLILSDHDGGAPPAPGAPSDTAEPAEAARIDGVMIGEIAGFDGDGEVLVTFPGIPGGAPLRARCAAPLTGDEAGRQVALQFERGDPRRPLLMGMIHRPDPTRGGAARATEATVDGRRITFTAADEIVFRCGDASITLTRAGKILIRGAYVLTRSSGVNRIQGGSVQIN